MLRFVARPDVRDRGAAASPTSPDPTAAPPISGRGCPLAYGLRKAPTVSPAVECSPQVITMAPHTPLQLDSALISGSQDAIIQPPRPMSPKLSDLLPHLLLTGAKPASSSRSFRPTSKPTGSITAATGRKRPTNTSSRHGRVSSSSTSRNSNGISTTGCEAPASTA